ncbi:hypothetical protein [Mycolicibacterium mengxianglii]|uniref:hypothetical protein n=1 Tax=Mycolicibacterium mengxianglii TaxID=2736649 RepID=UPI0018EEF785|nr:hypothetical protein [Mycolicibacterium mengxianglii]
MSIDARRSAVTDKSAGSRFLALGAFFSAAEATATDIPHRRQQALPAPVGSDVPGRDWGFWNFLRAGIFGHGQKEADPGER